MKILPTLMLASLVSFLGFVCTMTVIAAKDLYDSALPQAYVEQSQLFNSYVNTRFMGDLTLEKLMSAHGGDLLQPGGTPWNMLPASKDLKYVTNGKVILLGSEGSVTESACKEIQQEFNKDTSVYEVNNKSEIGNVLYFNPRNSRGGCMLIKGSGASPYLILG
ncbi:hypothetical protein [uncultured Methylophaga sp.]|uniref:hypothetical protein n=1 Tax=uncultured Methylophaga sp. TaxID=285271 RepID=UPI00262930CE|nr:hypothetical protein [uncultured Methylophaga sp.]